MKLSNRNSFLLAFLVLLLGVGGVLGLYWQLRYIPISVEQVDFTDFASEASDTIYRSEAYRYGFQTPVGWKVEESGTRVIAIPPKLSGEQPFQVEVTTQTLEEYKGTREALGEYARVFDEQKDVPGHEDAVQFKVSTATGADDTVLFIRRRERNVVLNFRAFSEAHQQILQSFQFLN